MLAVTSLGRALLLGLLAAPLAACAGSSGSASHRAALSLASTSCTAPADPGTEKVAVNIDTTFGCAPGPGSVSGSQATSPITGWITIDFPSGSASATGADAISNPPGDSGPYVTGRYQMLFSQCQGGTATGGAYTVTGGQYPGAPSMSAGNPLSFSATGPGGALSCAYTVSYPFPFPAPDRAMTNDVLVDFGGGASTHAATPSVAPPSQGPPPVIPESPLAIGLPLAGLAILSGVFGLALRRRGMAAGPPRRFG